MDREQRSGRTSKQREYLHSGWESDQGRRDDRRGTEVGMATKAARKQRARTSRVSRGDSGQPTVPDSGKTAARKEGKTSTFHTAKDELLRPQQPHQRHF